MATIAIVVPTTNNFDYLVRMIESAKDYTWDAKIRFIVIDNGSVDQTAGYLRSLKQGGLDITIISNDTNVGFVKATNQGLREVKEGEIICLANDDIQFTDPFTLARLTKDIEDPDVGMAVPTSDYVMGLQKLDLSFQIPATKHETNFAIYFCGLMRYDVFQKIGLLDERFGQGGNDDMDYAIRMHEAGYKILIDRNVFVKHYGSRTLLRTNDTAGYDNINKTTRAILVDKWGQEKVDALFRLPDFLLYGPQYYAQFGHGGYQRNEFWLAEWKRIATKIVETLHPRDVLDVGCAMGMLVEALKDLGVQEVFGLDVSEYAISNARSDLKSVLKVGSLVTGGLIDADLITCIEVVEHLNEADGKKAVANMCRHANRILFSSTPDDTTEATHQNVRPKEYWNKLFEDNGFVPDNTYDASFLTAWATLYERKK